LKNGDYLLVVAPEEYPYKKYRDKYCYEHRLVYWLNFGEIPEDYEIHHKDENKHNNNIDNLELMSGEEHRRKHYSKKGRTVVLLKCPVCQLIFKKNISDTFMSKKGTYSCCSRSCSGTFSNYKEDKKKKGIKENVIEIYKEYD